MRFSEEIFGALEAVRVPMLDASARLVAHPLFSTLVPQWFLQLYQVMRATIPTLEFADQRAHWRGVDEGYTDFLCELTSYFAEKLKDEDGHDEMMLDDLEALGVIREWSMAQLPPPSISALVGSQYYFIEYVHPAAYLGYIALLEGAPLSLEQIDMLQERSNTPKEAWRTARIHSRADPAHRESLARILDQVPESLRTAVATNAIRSSNFQTQALESLLSRADGLFESQPNSRQAGRE